MSAQFNPRLRRASATAIPAVVAALVGLLALPSASGGEPTTTASFRLSGSTSQGSPVRLLVSERDTRVGRFALSWRAPCPSGKEYSGSPSYGPFRIRCGRSGFSFGGVASYTEQPTGAPGYSAAVQESLSGRITDAGARGTWRSVVTVRDANGQPVDTCATGTITWRARLR